MEVIIKNRIQAQKDSFQTLSGTVAIISINTPGDEPNRFAENSYIKGILYLSFNDIEEEWEPGTFMSDDDAEKIKNFIDCCMRDAIECLWVHCDAGVSRSAGVAAAILKHISGSDSAIFDNPNYFPNMHCYRLVLDAFKGG